MFTKKRNTEALGKKANSIVAGFQKIRKELTDVIDESNVSKKEISEERKALDTEEKQLDAIIENASANLELLPKFKEIKPTK